jgi:hypothetical protein
MESSTLKKISIPSSNPLTLIFNIKVKTFLFLNKYTMNMLVKGNLVISQTFLSNLMIDLEDEEN